MSASLITSGNVIPNRSLLLLFYTLKAGRNEFLPLDVIAARANFFVFLRTLMTEDKNEVFRSLCPIATGLDVIGDKWTLLVLRDMLFGYKSTFNEFKTSPELMPSKMLSNRLKKLEAWGFLSRKKGETNKKNVHYILEEKGIETFPIMVEMAIFTTDFYYDHLGDTYTGVVKTRMKNDKEKYIKEMMDEYRQFKEALVL